tara:strand:+ start:279 stop:563 length:285 start_codon:yes stop_codon:yes gene_type:complete
MRKRINPDDVKAGTLVKVIDQFSSRVPIGSVGLVVEWEPPVKVRNTVAAIVEAWESGFFGHCVLLINGREFVSTAEFLIDSCELVDDDEEMPTL